MFLHDVDHAPTTKPMPAFLFSFFDRYGRYKDPKKYESGRNLTEKRKKKKTGTEFVCACGSNTRLKNADQT